MNPHRLSKPLPPVAMSDRSLVNTSLVYFGFSAVGVIFVVFYLNPLLEALGL